ncbi:XRE family transcriptional regulator [Streptomyces sp. NPDC048644]|uniref:XRE family transcriptional regulator n=1 Tax=Streptomyces sp. NPDC048644 TaxID=3365582 RepID=UPI0037211B22
MTAVVPERRWLREAAAPKAEVTFSGDAPVQPPSQPLRAPDTPLGRARLARGWSRERTVRALMALADRWGWQTATEGSMRVQLHRWEHQDSRPSETYRVLLCAVFQATPQALGFTVSAPQATTKTALSARVESLESMVMQLTDALSRTLGAPA